MANSDINLVTGGTGFIGAHIVRRLLGRGGRVRCLVRPGSNRSNLAGLSVEIAEGDLADRQTLRTAMEGIDTLYHCAADYRLWARRGEVFRNNVEGTRNVLAAAADANVRRVVYTSSVAAIGLEPDGSPATEQTAVHPGDLIGEYKKSKHEAELLARKAAYEGLPLVIVNPSTPVGEMDIKPTPTGQIIVDFLNRRMPAYVDTGLNIIDVRDVAVGHLLAAERGVTGQRYILGNRNMTLRELLDVLATLSGISAPRVRLPHWIPMIYAAADTAIARVTGHPPRAPLDAVRMSRHRMFFDSTLAVRELGLPQTSVEQALDRAIAWFRQNGYVKER